jgi:UDP-N-acetylmuramyl tripeptide synthase
VTTDHTPSAARNHTDTIRRLLPLWHVGGTQGDRVYAAVAAMEAEIERLTAILWPPALASDDDRNDPERCCR